MNTTQPVENIFARAWDLLTRNWIIIVPGIVIGLIIGVLTGLLRGGPIAYDPANPTAAMGTAMARFGSGLIIAGIGVIAMIANQAYTVGMAGAAWERGTTTLADGTASFQENAGRILITGLGMILLAIVAVVLSIPTLGLAFLAYYVFTLYAMPAAVVGKRDGFDSIKESFQIGMKRLGPTLILAVLIFVISLVAGLLTLPLLVIPFLGPIIQAIITQAVVAYVVLVVVGEYLALRSTVATNPYAAGAAPYAGGPTPYPPGPSAYTPPTTNVYTPPTSPSTYPTPPSPPSDYTEPPTIPPPGGSNL